MSRGLLTAQQDFYNNQAYSTVEKSVTFTGAAGLGAVGTVDLFTVTGSVKVKIYAVCETDLAGATATIEVGVTGSTAGLIAQSTATNIDANELWHDATPDAPIEASSVVAEKIIVNGLDIFATIANANITGGVIKFIVEWSPVSIDGSLVAA